jgi:hypothetical protein
MTSNLRYTMLDSTDIRCTRCGYENDPQFRFCGMCGAALRPLQAEDREADASAQTDHLSAQVTEPNRLPAEPMPIEPLLAQLTAARKFQQERPASPPASSYSSELRNEFHGAEPVHGQRTPVSVAGPSFLGLSESNDRGVEYLLEDEPHPGRKRTALALLLLLIAAGAWILHWRKTGSPGLFQSSAPLAAKSSASPQYAPVMPSEVAPPTANDQQKLEKPMTGVGDRPLPDDAAKTDDSAKSNTTASNNPTEAADNSGNRASGKPTSSNEAADTVQPPSTKKTQPDSAGTAETTQPSSRKSASETNRADRTNSDTAELAPAASNPAEDSLYLEGQKYLYGGHGVRQNCALAQQNLLAAAKNDNSKAESTLGTMYATGHCVPRDIPLAYRWFARALHADPRNTRLEKDAEIMWNQMTPPERQLALRNQ